MVGDPGLSRITRRLESNPVKHNCTRWAGRNKGGIERWMMESALRRLGRGAGAIPSRSWQLLLHPSAPLCIPRCAFTLSTEAWWYVSSMTLTDLSSPRHIGKLPVCLGEAASSVDTDSGSRGLAPPSTRPFARRPSPAASLHRYRAPLWSPTRRINTRIWGADTP